MLHRAVEHAGCSCLTQTYSQANYLVGRGRLELPSSYERQLLRLVRLPIPPPARKPEAQNEKV